MLQLQSHKNIANFFSGSNYILGRICEIGGSRMVKDSFATQFQPS